MVEKFNQTLQNMLVKFVADKQESWEEYLDTCVYAYNSSRHESSQYSPFEVMFGRRAVLPVDLAENKVWHTTEQEFPDNVLEPFKLTSIAWLSLSNFSCSALARRCW